MLSFEETMRKIKRETALSILRVVGFALFLLILALSFILWQQWNARREQLPEAPKSQELTDEQKKAILESLSVPPGAERYTSEEKRQILETLSAPSELQPLSEEEKKRILDSLNAPSQ